MTLPIKMNLDGNRLTVKDNVSNYNMNANFSSESNAIQNEYGFLENATLKDLTIIGFKKIFDNQVVIFSVSNNVAYNSEIGVLKNNIYSPILRDNIAENALFDFSIDHLIQCEAKININKEIIIYWVDGNTTDKFLNISNLQVNTTTDLMIADRGQIKNMIGYRLNSAVNVWLANTDSGGSLLTGTYQVLVVLANKGNLKTHSLIVSNQIPINQINNFFDGAPAGTATNRKIAVELRASDIDDNFDYVTVYAISKINQVSKAYEIQTIDSPSGNIIFEITEMVNEVSLDSIIINTSNYKNGLSITQVDDILYKGNLTSTDEFDFQPYINNIGVKYVQQPKDLAVNNYASSIACFYDKSFMYDEVYALYMSYLIEDNSILYETKAYHIPGRLPKTTTLNKTTGGNAKENDKINVLNPATNFPYYNNVDTDCTPLREMELVNPDARIFHGLDTHLETADLSTNMAYWENLNELYSTEDKWITKNIYGENVSGKDFRGQKVRHHKFPPAYMPNGESMLANNSVTSSEVNGFETNILGVKLENITIPEQFLGKVKSIKLYYAKRTYNNRTILGQSLAIPQGEIHQRFDETGNNSIYNNCGNFHILDVGADDPPSFNDLIYFGFIPTNTERLAPLAVGSLYDTGAGGIPGVAAGIIPQNYRFKNANGTSWTMTKGYIAMKPFDIMQQNLSVPGSYIKNVMRYKGKYVGIFGEGDSYIYANSNWRYGQSMDLGNDFLGFDRGEILGFSDNYELNKIRKTSNIKYVLNSNQVSTGNNGFDNPPYTYYSEQRIILEIDRRLKLATLNSSANLVGQDAAIVTYADPTDPGNGWGPTGIYGNGYSSPYLTNICSFKEDVYTSFDNQILCSTGFEFKIGSYGSSLLSFTFVIGRVYTISKLLGTDDFFGVGANISVGNGGTWVATGTTPTSWTSGTIVLDVTDTAQLMLNGDTFTSLYGERSTMDLAPQLGLTTNPAITRTLAQTTATHYYVCQSTSNIKLRHEGTNADEIYYPRATASTMAQLPGYVDTYWGYNIDYSAVNEILQPSQGLNRLDNDITNFPNRIIASQVNNIELVDEDNYLIFNPANTTDVGARYGQIENLISVNNKLGIHLSNNLMITVNRQTMDTSSGKAYIGSGEIFGVKPQSINSDFYGGIVGRYSGCMTPFGYFFIDPLNKKALVFDGQSFKVISDLGMERFFIDYSSYKFPILLNNINEKYIENYDIAESYLKNTTIRYNNSYWLSNKNVTSGDEPGNTKNWDRVALPSYDVRNPVSSLGTSIDFDPIYNRILFSKIDYSFTYFTDYIGIYNPNNAVVVGDYVTYNNVFGKFTATAETAQSIFISSGKYFTPKPFKSLYSNPNVDLIDNGFTLGYYPALESWVSFYSYRPDLLIGASNAIYSSKNNKLFSHNVKGSPFYYDTTPIKFFVEPLYKMNGSERLMSFNLKTEKTDNFSVPNPVFPFNKNNKVDQSETFDSYLVYNKNQMSKEIDFINTKTSRDVEGYFNVNDFRDFTATANPILFNLTSSNKEVNSLALNNNLHWTKQRKFVDFWQSARFTKEITEFYQYPSTVEIEIDGTFICSFILPLNTIIKIGSSFIVVDYPPTVLGNYVPRYVLNSSILSPGIYNIEVFSTYNLALLDTQSNQKKSFR